MEINEFKLERFFEKYEFAAKYLLCCSDCEGLTQKELLNLADTKGLDLWENLTLGYTESKGHPILRQEISKLYEDIYPSEILVAAPEEAIFIAMNTILTTNDHIIVTYPGYQSLFEIANSIGCGLSKWEPDYDTNGFSFDIEKLEALVQKNTKMIIINFPHNPTGAHINQEQLNKIVNLADNNNIFLFADEMYQFLEHNQNNRIKSICDLYENGISLCGMSKSFSLAGLRIGWLATKNKQVYKKATEFKDYTTICNSAPSEILAIIGLRAKNEIIKRNLNIIQTNLNLLDAFFKRYKSIFDWHRPSAGSIAFPHLKLDKPVSLFCKEVLDQKSVLLLPSDLYEYKSNNFRIGFARKNMPQSLDKLEEYIKAICK
ncbi:MAG: aminotransferase class I/II-fold pyridoxal phosphate-dependent enzyme [Desulfobacteraceae bacterium]|nr:aminotransferase class I/II-fold pyridoxal phosphate-dependent enzyme [Desulfobacteraceae bacterium]